MLEITASPITARRRWPEEVYEHARKYVDDHPCFYLEELQASLKLVFPDLPNTSIPTICRALCMDLKLSIKVMLALARVTLLGGMLVMSV